MSQASADDVNAFIKVTVHDHNHRPSELLQILRKIQTRYSHIPAAAIHELSSQLHIPGSRIRGVVEFYSFLHLQPRGRFDILFSDSITDRMLGKQPLMDSLCQKLNIGIGETRADGQVSIDNTSCTGLCDQGPALLINGYAIGELDDDRIDRIAHLIEAHATLEQWPDELFQVHDNIRRSALLLTPEFKPGQALEAAIQRDRDSLLETLAQSGLRGRGGAGFSTALKWRYCRETAAAERYVVCNADEGEPGTFKDRVLLNTYPDLVFEGMTLCAHIIGARQGYLYLRGEYLFLLAKLRESLEQRRQQGLLGRNILGIDGFDFDIDIHLGAGAYICGEESALIESLEGKPGIPRNRPPYPVTHGYQGQPTVVNNVETFAAAAKIASNGSDWFKRLGTTQSAGSKILSICGDCEKPGLYEYPFGITIRDILSDCGADSELLGIQVGGPSGTFIAAREFDRRLGFEDLATGGSFMIFNTSRKLLEIVANFTGFFAHESCGFCTPCRVGTTLLKNLLAKVVRGHGTAADLLELERLGQQVKSSSHCGLGHTAPNPLLDSLERFPDHYQQQLSNTSFHPGFDLDSALETARRMSARDDQAAHLQQVDS